MVAGWPFMCMRQTAQALSRTASKASGVPSAWTSLIMDAPAASAAFMPAGRRVSTETQRSPSACSTGRTRAHSSSSDTGAAPGRVDSPPMSMMCAPSSASLRACAMAERASKNLPPSEKESGVTLTTPMMSGWSSWNENLPQRSTAADSRRALVPSLCGRGRRRRALGAGIAGRRLGRLRGGGLRRTRRLAGHDVVDLVGVDRLPLEQRLGHCLYLVAVVLEQLPRHPVLRVDDMADLGVDLLHGRFGHVLVRLNRASEEDLALVLAVDHRAELVRHAPLRHHAAGNLGGTLEVVRGAGRHLLHEELFGNAPTEQYRDHVEQPIAVLAVAVLGRQLHGHAERASARDDRHLVHRIGLRQ